MGKIVKHRGSVNEKCKSRVIINYLNNQITYAPGPNGARDTWAHESGSLIEMIKLKPPAKADVTRVVKQREHKDARSAQHS